jgi:chorismate-pyruvate lyase
MTPDEMTIDEWIKSAMKDPEMSEPIPKGEPSLAREVILRAIQPIYTYWRTIALLGMVEEQEKYMKEADIFVQGRVIKK